jgi:hypothetical protein
MSSVCISSDSGNTRKTFRANRTKASRSMHTHTPSSRDIVSAGLRLLWLLRLFHHDDLRLADVVVPLSFSSRDIVSAGLRPLCFKFQVPERVLASNPAMSNVCIGSDNRNTHTHLRAGRS